MANTPARGTHRGSVRVAVLALILSFLLQPLAQGSIVLFIFTSKGIVIGADGKPTHFGSTPGPTHLAKLVVVQNRIAIASMNLENIQVPMRDRTNGQMYLFSYEFGNWISTISDLLPPNISVSKLAEIIEQKSGLMKPQFDALIRSGLVIKNLFPTDVLVNYFVTGYEKGAIQIYEIDFKIDWSQRTVTRVTTHNPITLHGTQWGEFVPPGLTTPYGIFKGSGEAYREAIAKDREDIQKLSGNSLSLPEATRVVKLLMKIEAEHVPDHVGPPYTIVTILRNGSADTRIYN